MITHSEYVKHANLVHEAIVRNGDSKTALSVMDKSEAISVRKSMQVLMDYKLQKRMISHAEFQTNANVVREAIVRNGDLKTALSIMDESEAASIRKSLQILKNYGLQMRLLKQKYNSK